jgi:hypothetical protein
MVAASDGGTGAAGTIVGIPAANGAAAYTQANASQINAPAVCAGTANSGFAEVCSTSPSFTPAAGDRMVFKNGSVAVAGTFTINVNSMGVKTVKKQGGWSDLVANDILASQYVELIYDGTNWEMQGQTGNASAGGGSPIPVRMWYPNGYYSGTAANTTFSPTNANAGIRFPVTIPSPGISFNNVRIKINTGDAGKFARFAVFNDLDTSIACQSSAFSVDTAATGIKDIAMGSPCVLLPGTYYFHSTSDSTAAALTVYPPPGVELGSGNTDARGAIVGFASSGCVSTGAGASLAFNSSLALCSWNFTATVTPFLMGFKQ